jgi:iron(III) transport system permease protein
VVLPSLLAAFLTAVPLVYIFLRAAEGGPGAYLQEVFSSATAYLLGRTLALVAGVVALSLLVAVPLAWLVSRTDLPGRRLWAVLGALPLVFPSYVAAFALVAVLRPKGYLQSWLAPLGVERLPEIAYGYSGALLALALFTYPYTYLLLVAALRKVDPAQEESSRALGVGRWGTFFRVVLPQLQGALYGGSLLVVLYTLSDFGAVSIVRYDTFTLSIYNAYRGLFDRSVAASLATVLVAVSLAFIATEGRLLRRLRPPSGHATRPSPPIPLGRWRWPALLFLGLVTLVTVVLPLGVVGYWGVRTAAAEKPLERAIEAAAGSLSVSLLAAVVAVALAVPLAAWAVRYRGRGSRLVERMATAGFALPGLVIALSLVFFAARYLPWLYQSVALLVIGYVVRFLPEALAAARSSFLAIAPSFEEAARSLGHGGWKVLTTLTLPLLRPGLAAGAGLVFLTSMKELPATLLLRPIGFETLATRIWSAASEGIYSEASLPSLVLVLVSILPVYSLIIRPSLQERSG